MLGVANASYSVCIGSVGVAGCVCARMCVCEVMMNMSYYHVS